MTRTFPALWCLLICAGLVLSCSSGCVVSHSHGAAHCYVSEVPAWPGGPMCFGYYPTCWRPWPAECPPCPSPFAVMPKGEELIEPGLAPPGFPEEGLPLPSGDPVPPQAVPSLPEPEQESSARRQPPPFARLPSQEITR